ncbi:hypothetical protein J6590_038478 [Homalodisca vitripennis]|nr:hypothetical protein J6590_038478 [Homalodisca vitripennis]
MTDAKYIADTDGDFGKFNEIQDAKDYTPREDVNCHAREYVYEQNTEPQQGSFNYHKVDSSLSSNYPPLSSSAQESLYTPAQQIPVSHYTPLQQIPHLHAAPHGFSVFPTQNSSAHPLVFPPRALPDFYMTPKMNTPVHHYPQIPTYPPMPGSSHPIPLISTGLAPPIPQRTMLRPSPITPPHVQITPSLVGTVPIASIHMPPEYGNTSGQATTAFVMNKEPKIANMVASPKENLKQSTEKGLSSVVASSVNTSVTEASAEQKDTVVEQKEKREPAEGKKRADEGIQILPQFLVDGAIDVAASAYSTAWNALSNLRQKDGNSVLTSEDDRPIYQTLIELFGGKLKSRPLLRPELIIVPSGPAAA